MAELTHYRCPNCGASITNTENCEYCGSLLVRFVKRGIDLSKTSYQSNDKVFPGLIENLKKNLQFQDSYPNELVTTQIFREKGKLDNTFYGFVMSIIKIGGGVTYMDGQEVFPNMLNKKGLGITFTFHTYEDSGFDDRNKMTDKLFHRFQLLECFSLFNPHLCCFTDDDGEQKSLYYSINFGDDAEGAARLISEILEKVYQIPFTEQVDIFTNYGHSIVQAANKAYQERGRIELTNKIQHINENNNGGCLGVIVGFSLFLSGLFKLFI